MPRLNPSRERTLGVHRDAPEPRLRAPRDEPRVRPAPRRLTPVSAGLSGNSETRRILMPPEEGATLRHNFFSGAVGGTASPFQGVFVVPVCVGPWRDTE